MAHDRETPASVTIYTDGACAGNPGPGGWGAILISGEHRKELSGGEAATTNNRMELMAAISALEALKRPSRVDLHTDSEYVQNGITSWIHGWKKRRLENSRQEAGQECRAVETAGRGAARHEVTWHWVRGHAGDVENERADELAREGCSRSSEAAGVTTRPSVAAARYGRERVEQAPFTKRSQASALFDLAAFAHVPLALGPE